MTQGQRNKGGDAIRHLLTMLAMALACWGLTARADQINTVIHATPEWTGFTNPDGSGIYNELLSEIFAAQGITVQRQTVPINRAVALVERGDADFTGGFRRDDRNFADVPIYETRFAAMYRTGSGLHITSPDQLENLRVAAPPQVSTTLGKALTEVDSRAQAAKLLIAGRIDVYVDLQLPLERFRASGVANLDVANASDTRFDIRPEDWTITPISGTRLYLLFSDTPRGHALRDIYQKGTRALAKSGRLAALYQHYGLEVPTID
ncbi:substrate-binding periplasmic protein [Tropicibacter oceani]|uniref:Transporter substrate-binding domain-containing protein n=1 Tax=Tropicibacter oceani TaxID=3058420 RepID=A0ABY8QM27_9RHOB|nr:transporter substrate-binding domain-containing protein [Tropicibacter oceani]WGW05689.1 transporter substrate-binding domain-containing protein [Tropicibacter oceani]